MREDILRITLGEAFNFPMLVSKYTVLITTSLLTIKYVNPVIFQNLISQILNAYWFQQD
jgi:hypothetical protein